MMTSLGGGCTGVANSSAMTCAAAIGAAAASGATATGAATTDTGATVAAATGAAATVAAATGAAATVAAATGAAATVAASTGASATTDPIAWVAAATGAAATVAVATGAAATVAAATAATTGAVALGTPTVGRRTTGAAAMAVAAPGTGGPGGTTGTTGATDAVGPGSSAGTCTTTIGTTGGRAAPGPGAAATDPVASGVSGGAIHSVADDTAAGAVGACRVPATAPPWAAPGSTPRGAEAGGLPRPTAGDGAGVSANGGIATGAPERSRYTPSGGIGGGGCARALGYGTHGSGMRHGGTRMRRPIATYTPGDEFGIGLPTRLPSLGQCAGEKGCHRNVLAKKAATAPALGPHSRQCASIRVLVNRVPPPSGAGASMVQGGKPPRWA